MGFERLEIWFTNEDVLIDFGNQLKSTYEEEWEKRIVEYTREMVIGLLKKWEKKYLQE